MLDWGYDFCCGSVCRFCVKHHYTESDIHHVLLHPVYDEIQDEGGDKHLLIGFDCNMNLVEIVYNIIDEQLCPI
ncbi:hypothetical protein AGMMS49991_05780 [Spirochaetia bacterium]|nr:hypothetical protein AGMMS49991_05780 [Spirochaetia bacterium]